MMYQLFKGYIPTKNKEPKISYKGKSSDQLRTLEEVSTLDEYAGVMNDDTILIDIDDTEMSELLFRIVEDMQLRCKVIQTTRGKHFYFRNTETVQRVKTGKTLACGVVSDIKLGMRSSIAVLKYNKKERPVIYDIFEDEDYQTVPKWMTPISSKKQFWKMENGDGRNQELFNYILTLQANDFTKDEAIETIRIINKYVMKEPLSESELNVILRDEAFQKPIFFKGNTFLFDKFATFMKNEYNIIRIDGVLHLYREGIYVAGRLEIESEMIKHIPSLSQARRSEVMSYLEIMIRDEHERSSADFIAFNNGIYNISMETMEEPSPSKIITNKIPHNYNPEAYSEIVDKTLDKLSCNDSNIRLLLEEIIGYSFYRRNELRKMFILKGERHNGKSTYLYLISRVLGQNNISTLDIKDLNDKFRPSMLLNKLCNIGDDINNAYLRDTSYFKKVVSGDPVTVEEKGKPSFILSSYAKQIFSANSIPRMGTGSDIEAILDRMIIVPLNAKFTADDPDFDPYIKYKLMTSESMEYLINIGIKGLKRVLKNNKFTETNKTEMELKEYEESNNPMLQFFNEVDDGEIKLENESTKECYKRYKEFCLEFNFYPVSHAEFSRQVRKQYGFESVPRRLNGKTLRIFKRKGAEL